MKTLPLLILSLALAACGAGNAPANNAAHDHPSGHVLGQFDLGDGYFMQASHEGSIKAGNEIDFDILLKKDGETADNAKIHIYATGADGKALGDKVTATWAAERKLYTAHLKLPADMPHEASMTFEAEVDGKSFKKSVAAFGHQHD